MWLDFWNGLDANGKKHTKKTIIFVSRDDITDITHRVYGIDEHLAQKVLVVGVHRLRHSVRGKQ